MEYKKVKEKDHLIRDLDTGAIINTDIESYNNYVESYKKKYCEAKKLSDLECELNSLKIDIQEIKTLLLHFINES